MVLAYVALPTSLATAVLQHQRAGPAARDQPPASLMLGISWIKSEIKESRRKRQMDKTVTMLRFSLD